MRSDVRVLLELGVGTLELGVRLLETFLGRATPLDLAPERGGLVL
jgi:hypothetical protein